MFDSVFENTFSNCLNSVRNICVLLKDDLLDSVVDVWSLTMRTVAPQSGVSIFEFDALDGQLNEDIISANMLDRIRNFSSESSLDEGRKSISSIYFAASVLENSVLVIYNAENISNELYQSIDKIEKALRVSGKGRLRVLLIGSESIIPIVARNTTSFNKVKWYNLLDQPQNAAAMLSSIAVAVSGDGSIPGEISQVIQEQAEKDLIIFGTVL